MDTPIDQGNGIVSRCSFCNRSVEQVEQLIAGPNYIYICNGCVETCNQILEEQRTHQRERDESKDHI